jgi:hypothetical protein
VSINDTPVSRPGPLYDDGAALLILFVLIYFAMGNLVAPMSVGGLIFRVTRFHALSGLVFDVVGRRRRVVS